MCCMDEKMVLDIVVTPFVLFNELCFLDEAFAVLDRCYYRRLNATVCITLTYVCCFSV